MKIICANVSSFVIMSSTEFEKLLMALPERDLIQYLIDIGCKRENLIGLTKQALISKIYIEYTENM